MAPASLDPTHATRLLSRLSEGDPSAGDELMPLLYEELRQVAERCMGRQAAEHTLQPTALVHEAWMRLSAAGGAAVRDRVHFVRLAARTMRHVLVDHARAKATRKRGAAAQRVPLDGVLASFEERSLDVVALSEALEGLAAKDPELARIVELRFFAGLTVEQVAEVLGVSERTVHRAWRVARLWLRDELSVEGDG